MTLEACEAQEGRGVALDRTTKSVTLGPRLSQQAQAGGGGHAEKDAAIPPLTPSQDNPLCLIISVSLSSARCEHPPIMG